jgi:type IV secretory pathway VirB2 component (pilin)
VLLAVAVGDAMATSADTASVPWNTALDNLLSILSGTTARLLAALAFIGGGIIWAFSRNDEGMQMVGRVVMAAGLMVGAVSLTNILFGAAI